MKLEFSKFPKVFWSANTTELFERAAYYSMASFVVLYLKDMGMSAYFASTLNGVMWGLLYFLPVLSGSMADHFGFRKALLTSFLLLFIGYMFMGLPSWAAFTSHALTASVLVTAIIIIGIGGSIVKPCISGTVQKSAPAALATLGYGIFYMVINVGSLTGRAISYVVRTHTTLSSIFAVAMVLAVIAFFVVFLFYVEPEEAKGEGKDLKETLRGMFTVLKEPRFVLFLFIAAGFNMIYHQVYNVIPLFLRSHVEKNPPVDLYTMANPFVIVFFQLAVTKFFGWLKPVTSMAIGTVIISLAMAINILPPVMGWDLTSPVLGGLMPLGGLFAVITVGTIALGELFSAPRTFEYIGALAPKGKEGLFLGYANLPIALGSLAGGPIGAYIHESLMKQGREVLGWSILAGVGLISALATWLYGLWAQAHKA